MEQADLKALPDADPQTRNSANKIPDGQLKDSGHKDLYQGLREEAPHILHTHSFPSPSSSPETPWLGQSC